MVIQNSRLAVVCGILLPVLMLTAGIASAYSANYSAVNQGGIVAPSNATKTILVPLTVSASLCNYCHYGRAYVDNPHITIQYGVEVTDASTGATIPAGSTVQTGRHIIFRFKPHVSEDIYWFATGHFLSSPYGDWVTSQSLASGGPDVVPAEAGGSKENLCSQKNLITSPSNINGNSYYGSLSVNDPTKHIDGLSGLSCTPIGNNGLDCVFSSEGQIQPVFIFDATNARFFLSKGDYETGDGCGSSTNLTYKGTARKKGSSAPFVLSIPQATIEYPLSVAEASGVAPTDPSISADASCVAGSAFSVSMVSTDPDGDGIHYGIDWNSDDVLDQWAPPAGLAASGVSQAVSRIYATPGSKSIRVFAEDAHGLRTGWVSYTFDCAGPGNPLGGDQCPNLPGNQVAVPNGYLIDSAGSCVASGDIGWFTNNGNAGDASGWGRGRGTVSPDLSLRAIPSLVRRGVTTQIHWSATNVSECTVTGSNGDTWDGVESPVGGETSSPINSRVEYTLNCLDTTGSTATRKASVNILPAWLEN